MGVGTNGISQVSVDGLPPLYPGHDFSEVSAIPRAGRGNAQQIKGLDKINFPISAGIQGKLECELQFARGDPTGKLEFEVFTAKS